MNYHEWNENLDNISWMTCISNWNFRKFHPLMNDKILNENKIWMNELKIIGHDARDLFHFEITWSSIYLLHSPISNIFIWLGHSTSIPISLHLDIIYVGTLTLIEPKVETWQGKHAKKEAKLFWDSNTFSQVW